MKEKKETDMLHYRINIVIGLQVLLFTIRHKDKSFFKVSWRIDESKKMSILLTITFYPRESVFRLSFLHLQQEYGKK